LTIIQNLLMEIVHVSAECYPVAKAGGVGDVVGALPKYQNLMGHVAKVVMPMYRTKFLYENEWEVVHKEEPTSVSGGLSIPSSRKNK
jgi:starch synthase